VADKGATKGDKMTYKEAFPNLVIRDREEVKDTIASVLPKRQDLINARIDALLEDAFQRGCRIGMERVIGDPGSFGLYANPNE
jgi:hypothetical protein